MFKTITAIWAVILLIAPGCAKDQSAGYFYTSPDRSKASHTVYCKGATYLLEHETSKAEGNVSLINFDRREQKIPKAKIAQMSAEFGKFTYIESTSFSCGVAGGESGDIGSQPAGFLLITLRGRFQEGTAVARETCLKKGWEFDPISRRDFLVEGSTITIDGEGAGYCFRNAGSFNLTVPLDREKSE